HLVGLIPLIFASLVAVTTSKWARENRKNAKFETKARSADVSVAGNGGKKKAAEKRSYPVYRIQDVRLHNNQNDAWVVIGDGVYDMTKWAPHHPGGQRNIVDISGRDVTDVFEAFHHEPRQREKLENFRVGTLVGYSPSALVKEFRALKQQITDEGLFVIDDSFFLKRYFILLPILVVAVTLIIMFQGQTSVQMLGAALVGLYWQQLAFLGHDAGHRSHMTNRASDDFTAYCMILPMLGIGPEWWIDSHNIHHVVCNDVICDPDIQHLPFMAISPKFFASLYSTYHERVMSWDFLGRCLVSVQHILFYPIMCISRAFLYVQSIVFILSKTRAKHRVHEIAAYAVFFGWNGYLCSLFEGGWNQAGYFLLAHAVSGILHVQITLSHFSMPVTERPQYMDDNEGWVATQLLTTLDVDCHPCMDWFHGGLQFQALHHLFPKLPRYNLRSVQSRVRALAEKHGLHYHCVSFIQANIETFKGLKDTAKQAWSSDFKFTDSMLYEGANLIG
ncbi:unnamed protein product, partial [Choristocarpus tenellus]